MSIFRMDRRIIKPREYPWGFPVPIKPYEDFVLADSPLIYWRMEGLSDEAVHDSSGNGYDGSWSSSISGLYFNQPGLIAQGDTCVRKISGGDYYMNHAALSGVTLTAMECWFTFTQLGNFYCPISACMDNYHRVLLTNSQYPNNILRVASGANGGAAVITADETISADNIYHVVVFYNILQNKTYLMINGTVQSQSFSGNIFSQMADPIPIVFGYIYSSQYDAYMLGFVDEVAFYNTNVSRSIFETHYIAGTC